MMPKDKDPLDEALELREKLAAAVRLSEKLGSEQKEDLRLWSEWKANPNPQTTNAWLNRLKPVLRAQDQMRRGGAANPYAVSIGMKEDALKASKNYNPEFGAAPVTWIQSNLRGTQRNIANVQNAARIVEEDVYKIGPLQRLQEQMQNQLGRTPTAQEMARTYNQGASSRRKLTANKLQTILNQANIKDVPMTSMEYDPMPHTARRGSEVMSLLADRYSKANKPEHVKMLKMVYGDNITSSGALAKKLNWHPSKVSRIKSEIEDEYRGVMKMPDRKQKK